MLCQVCWWVALLIVGFTSVSPRFTQKVHDLWKVGTLKKGTVKRGARFVESWCFQKRNTSYKHREGAKNFTFKLVCDRYHPLCYCIPEQIKYACGMQSRRPIQAQSFGRDWPKTNVNEGKPTKESWKGNRNR